MSVPAVTIDGFGLERLDFLKIDVEGMELEVLEGARATLERLHPMLMIEHIKTDATALHVMLDAFGYQRFIVGMNVVAVHPSDPSLGHLSVTPQ